MPWTITRYQERYSPWARKFDQVRYLCDMQRPDRPEDENAAKKPADPSPKPPASALLLVPARKATTGRA